MSISPDNNTLFIGGDFIITQIEKKKRAKEKKKKKKREKREKKKKKRGEKRGGRREERGRSEKSYQKFAIFHFEFEDF